MLKHVLTEHWKYEDPLKNRWNKNTASIMIIMGMMDSKRRIKDTTDTNMQIRSEQADTSRTSIAGIRDMMKDTTGPMGGNPATNRIMDMSLTNGK